jgi:hypothetical protein
MRRAILIVMLVARSASADCICRFFDHFIPDDPSGEAWAHYELTDYERLPDSTNAATPAIATTRTSGGIAREILGGFRLGGIIGGKHRLEYHAEIDLFAGGTMDRGGFAYDVAFYPLGVGMKLGETGLVALGTGIVATGATRWLDDGVGLPLQATLELGGGRVRFLGRGRIALLAGTHDDAAPSLPFGQELEAMAGVRIGHHYDEWGFPAGNGYFLAVAYKEMLGERYLGLTIGYSIDGGMSHGIGHRHRSAEDDDVE